MIEADTSRGRKVDGKLTTWPEEEKLARPVREYLAALDQAAAAEATDRRCGKRHAARQPARRAESNLSHRSDRSVDQLGADESWLRLWRHYLLDLQRAIIVDVDVTPALERRSGATKTMLERTRERFDLKRNALGRMPPMDRSW